VKRLNAKLTDDEERAKDIRIGTLDWPRSSSFGPATCSDLVIIKVSNLPYKLRHVPHSNAAAFGWVGI